MNRNRTRLNKSTNQFYAKEPIKQYEFIIQLKNQKKIDDDKFKELLKLIPKDLQFCWNRGWNLNNNTVINFERSCSKKKEKNALYKMRKTIH